MCLFPACCLQHGTVEFESDTMMRWLPVLVLWAPKGVVGCFSPRRYRQTSTLAQARPPPLTAFPTNSPFSLENFCTLLEL